MASRARTLAGRLRNGARHWRQFDALTIPVDDLRTITAPIDIIHGDSAVETMAALLHFRGTPAIFVCHGWEVSRHIAPSFPRILRYIAVDDTCADRLLTRDGIACDTVSVRRLESRPTEPRMKTPPGLANLSGVSGLIW
jgi:hypothetical protein